MDDQQALIMARTAGLATLPIGAAMLLAPRWFVDHGAAPDRSTARMIGALDLAIAPGLLAGRPRWPWLAARAAANVLTAGALLRTRTPHAKPVALVLAGLTIGDGLATVQAHRSRL